MEESEDDLKLNNPFTLSSKKHRSQSSKAKYTLKKLKKIQKGKIHISNIQRVLNKNISLTKPLNLIFPSERNNYKQPLPLLSSNILSAKQSFDEQYFIINDEMKINKNLLESNLSNYLKKRKVKNLRNINNNVLISSCFQIKENDNDNELNEKNCDSCVSEDQKSIETFNKGSFSSNANSIKNNLSTGKKKKKKLKVKAKHKNKSVKTKKYLFKIFNKPNNINNNSSNRGRDFSNFNMNSDKKIVKNKNKNVININLINNNININFHLAKNRSAKDIKNVNKDIIKNKIPYNNDYNNKNNNNNLPNDYNNKSLFSFKANFIKWSTSKQQTQFSIYHFHKSQNIYLFIKNSKFSKKQIKSTKIFEIEENFYLPAAYRPRMNKWPNMPKCIEETCNRGGIFLIKSLENCNIIWKLMNSTKMRELIRAINNSQKYNHFPSTFQLGRKDYLYKHIRNCKRIFPDLYNFAPPTYILPSDAENFEFDFKKNRKNLWIVKPVNLSRGRGVHLLKGESEFKNLYKKSLNPNNLQYLISKYIDKPHLINKKKYDLRIYVIITSFSPLRIYLYDDGLVRFATENYKKGDYNNVFIHLTNYSINKNNVNYKPNSNIEKDKIEIGEEDENNDENEIDDNFSKWSLFEYRNYFKKNNKLQIMDKIWKQIQDIIIKTILSVSEDYYKETSINKMNSLFELYGFDILIDENFRAWLIEVNVNPSLHCTSQLDISIKTDLITDIFNVVGIIPYNHNNSNGEAIFNYLMKKTKVDFDINNEMFPKLRLTSNNYNLLNENLNNNNEKIGNKNKNIVQFLESSIMTIKSLILRNFDPNKLSQKLPEYENEFYKKILDNFQEEKARAECTGFEMIFPKKDNIDYYGQILIKNNAINDSNIVLWSYILNEVENK